MPKKKKFIDPKNAVTFHLVHRSQQDPLAADEKAPQFVLVPADKKQSNLDSEKRKEEQRKFGIYFDDDYDYLQHLRDASSGSYHWEPMQTTSNETKIQLPSSVFASEVEEEVGLLNKAAPRSGLCLDLDPDIVAAMDDDFDYANPDNELEDNFMELANTVSPDDEEDDDSMGEEDDKSFSENYDSEADDEVRSLNGSQFTFAEEETKSHFTNYSMSSSVIRRNEQLTLLDDCFEQRHSLSSSVGIRLTVGDFELQPVVQVDHQMSLPTQQTAIQNFQPSIGYQLKKKANVFETCFGYFMFKSEMFMKTYGDSDIGALDCEEIEGHIAPDSDILLKCVAETEKQDCTNKPLLNGHEAITYQDLSDDDNDNDDDLVYLKVEDHKEKWDCESILSTYSNLYNRPKIIHEPPKTKIAVSGKTGIPLGVIDGSTKLTKQALAKFNNDNQSKSGLCDETASVVSALSILSVRPKNEQPEEKKLRKKALREYRRERRMEKKANTLAFKDEKKKQEKIMLNNRTNIQGIHMT